MWEDVFSFQTNLVRHRIHVVPCWLLSLLLAKCSSSVGVLPSIFHAQDLDPAAKALFSAMGLESTILGSDNPNNSSSTFVTHDSSVSGSGAQRSTSEVDPHAGRSTGARSTAPVTTVAQLFSPPLTANAGASPSELFPASGSRGDGIAAPQLPVPFLYAESLDSGAVSSSTSSGHAAASELSRKISLLQQPARSGGGGAVKVEEGAEDRAVADGKVARKMPTGRKIRKGLQTGAASGKQTDWQALPAGAPAKDPCQIAAKQVQRMLPLIVADTSSRQISSAESAAPMPSTVKPHLFYQNLSILCAGQQLVALLTEEDVRLIVDQLDQRLLLEQSARDQNAEKDSELFGLGMDGTEKQRAGNDEQSVECSPDRARQLHPVAGEQRRAGAKIAHLPVPGSRWAASADTAPLLICTLDVISQVAESSQMVFSAIPESVFESIRVRFQWMLDFILAGHFSKDVVPVLVAAQNLFHRMRRVPDALSLKVLDCCVSLVFFCSSVPSHSRSHGSHQRQHHAAQYQKTAASVADESIRLLTVALSSLPSAAEDYFDLVRHQIVQCLIRHANSHLTCSSVALTSASSAASPSSSMPASMTADSLTTASSSTVCACLPVVVPIFTPASSQPLVCAAAGMSATRSVQYYSLMILEFLHVVFLHLQSIPKLMAWCMSSSFISDMFPHCQRLYEDLLHGFHCSPQYFAVAEVLLRCFVVKSLSCLGLAMATTSSSAAHGQSKELSGKAHAGTVSSGSHGAPPCGPAGENVMLALELVSSTCQFFAHLDATPIQLDLDPDFEEQLAHAFHLELPAEPAPGLKCQLRKVASAIAVVGHLEQQHLVVAANAIDRLAHQAGSVAVHHSPTLRAKKFFLAYLLNDMAQQQQQQQIDTRAHGRPTRHAMGSKCRQGQNYGCEDCTVDEESQDVLVDALRARGDGLDRGTASNTPGAKSRKRTAGGRGWTHSSSSSNRIPQGPGRKRHRSALICDDEEDEDGQVMVEADEGDDWNQQQREEDLMDDAELLLSGPADDVKPNPSTVEAAGAKPSHESVMLQFIQQALLHDASVHSLCLSEHLSQQQQQHSDKCALVLRAMGYVRRNLVSSGLFRSGAYKRLIDYLCHSLGSFTRCAPRLRAFTALVSVVKTDTSVLRRYASGRLATIFANALQDRHAPVRRGAIGVLDELMQQQQQLPNDHASDASSRSGARRGTSAAGSDGEVMVDVYLRHLLQLTSTSVGISASGSSAGQLADAGAGAEESSVSVRKKAVEMLMMIVRRDPGHSRVPLVLGHLTHCSSVSSSGSSHPAIGSSSAASSAHAAAALGASAASRSSTRGNSAAAEAAPSGTPSAAVELMLDLWTSSSPELAVQQMLRVAELTMEEIGAWKGVAAIMASWPVLFFRRCDIEPGRRLIDALAAAGSAEASTGAPSADVAWAAKTAPAAVNVLCHLASVASPLLLERRICDLSLVAHKDAHWCSLIMHCCQSSSETASTGNLTIPMPILTKQVIPELIRLARTSTVPDTCHAAIRTLCFFCNGSSGGSSGSPVPTANGLLQRMVFPQLRWLFLQASYENLHGYLQSTPVGTAATGTTGRQKVLRSLGVLSYLLRYINFQEPRGKKTEPSAMELLWKACAAPAQKSQCPFDVKHPLELSTLHLSLFSVLEKFMRWSVAGSSGDGGGDGRTGAPATREVVVADDDALVRAFAHQAMGALLYCQPVWAFHNVSPAFSSSLAEAARAGAGVAAVECAASVVGVLTDFMTHEDDLLLGTIGSGPCGSHPSLMTGKREDGEQEEGTGEDDGEEAGKVAERNAAGASAAGRGALLSKQPGSGFAGARVGGVESGITLALIQRHVHQVMDHSRTRRQRCKDPHSREVAAALKLRWQCALFLEEAMKQSLLIPTSVVPYVVSMLGDPFEPIRRSAMKLLLSYPILVQEMYVSPQLVADGIAASFSSEESAAPFDVVGVLTGGSGTGSAPKGRGYPRRAVMNLLTVLVERLATEARRTPTGSRSTAAAVRSWVRMLAVQEYKFYEEVAAVVASLMKHVDRFVPGLFAAVSARGTGAGADLVSEGERQQGSAAVVSEDGVSWLSLAMLMLLRDYLRERFAISGDMLEDLHSHLSTHVHDRKEIRPNQAGTPSMRLQQWISVETRLSFAYAAAADAPSATSAAALGDIPQGASAVTRLRKVVEELYERNHFHASSACTSVAMTVRVSTAAEARKRARHEENADRLQGAISASRASREQGQGRSRGRGRGQARGRGRSAAAKRRRKAYTSDSDNVLSGEEQEQEQEEEEWRDDGSDDEDGAFEHDQSSSSSDSELSSQTSPAAKGVEKERYGGPAVRRRSLDGGVGHDEDEDAAQFVL